MDRACLFSPLPKKPIRRWALSVGRADLVAAHRVAWATGKAVLSLAIVRASWTHTVVELPLRSPSFIPGKKGYERAYHCLDAWDKRRAQQGMGPAAATWPMLFVWDPPQHTDASGYAGADIKFPPALVPPHKVRACPLEVRVHHLQDVWVPNLETRRDLLLADHTSDVWIEQYQTLLEYAGLLMMHSPRLETFDRCDPAIAQYFVPAPCAAGTMLHIHIRGFVPSTLAGAIVHRVEEHLAQPNVLPTNMASIGQWAIASLTGFPDTPIAWRSAYPGLGLALGSGQSLQDAGQTRPSPSARKARGKGVLRRGESEHGFLRTGENGWTALLLPTFPTGASAPRQGTLFVESLELDTRN